MKSLLGGCFRQVFPRRFRSSSCVRARRERSVFQAEPPRGTVTLLDVEDAMATCSVCRDAESRHECFDVFGIDAQKVDVYYHITKRLENNIEKNNEPYQTFDLMALLHGNA